MLHCSTSANDILASRTVDLKKTGEVGIVRGREGDREGEREAEEGIEGGGRGRGRGRTGEGKRGRERKNDDSQKSVLSSFSKVQ